MITYDEIYKTNIDISQKTLLLNIETTGLSPANAFICMIGMAWMEEEHCRFRCLLAENRMDERKMMNEFHQHISLFDRILTYGGHNFSWRFINNRWQNYSDSSLTDENPEDFFGTRTLIDIQRNLASYKDRLDLTDLKKYSVEEWISFRRHSLLPGKELVNIYSEWERSHSEKLKEQLLSHHRDDLLSLLHLSEFCNYIEFFRGDIQYVSNWELFGSTCIFTLQLKKAVPKSITYHTECALISLKQDTAIVTVQTYTGELKYFLPGSVKDYYYLPAEDQAIHRSVACYVDKTYRQRATAATCYVRQDGIYLPTKDKHVTPHFQQDYQSKLYYILYEPHKWQQDQEMLVSYITSVL